MKGYRGAEKFWSFDPKLPNRPPYHSRKWDDSDSEFRLFNHCGELLQGRNSPFGVTRFRGVFHHVDFR